ncbi:MAG: hypothetical protein JNJ58_01055 [Chitinophagaceae bacterium]|nr:hypothetical protein [Chitinophagaceae bacterium]
MKRILFPFSILLIMVSLAVKGQHQSTAEYLFLEYLNNYQKDSLQNLLSEDFEFKRSYTTLTMDKANLIEKYLPESKAFQGKFIVLKVLHQQDPKQFLVEDQSNYLKYLKVDYPTWKMTITVKNNLIEQVYMDTTDKYQDYVKNVKIVAKVFMNWLQKHYPEETEERLFNEEGLLEKRLKEYSEKEE